jgi:hypothetical protein
VVQRARDQLEVLGLTQELRRHVVPHIVKPEALEARALAHGLPFQFRAGIGQRGAIAPALAPLGPLTDVGEDSFEVMALERF